MRYRSMVNGVGGVCARAGPAKSSGKPRLNARTRRPALRSSAAHSKYLCHMMIFPVLAQPGLPPLTGRLERVGPVETRPPSSRACKAGHRLGRTKELTAYLL